MLKRKHNHERGNIFGVELTSVCVCMMVKTRMENQCLGPVQIGEVRKRCGGYQSATGLIVVHVRVLSDGLPEHDGDCGQNQQKEHANELLMYILVLLLDKKVFEKVIADLTILKIPF